LPKRFRLNPRLDEELADGDDYKDRLRESAEAVQKSAAGFASRAQAPWMKRQAETIIVNERGDQLAVINTDYAGHLMEWGSVNNHAHAPLRRGVRSAGLQFEEA
jgi:hypothetical protein